MIEIDYGKSCLIVHGCEHPAGCSSGERFPGELQISADGDSPLQLAVKLADVHPPGLVTLVINHS